MRFRSLKLVRYGGFADRLLEFGDGQPDLHLIVGPNEAGKSTMLEAISDLLFGIGGQTRQAWLYPYGDLRIRAAIEHEGRVLDVTRRKGVRDTLLQPDGRPYGEDPLLPLLGGLDRGGFRRMYGLDHSRLREGGEEILRGRDDAARIVLQASTGLAGIGDQLAQLEERAGKLFKPGGQNPPVNALMRKLADAKGEARQAVLGEAEWKELKDKRAALDGRRDAISDELSALERRQAQIERVNRARAPLARLRATADALALIGLVPDLPSGSAEQLAVARSHLATTARRADDLRARVGELQQIIHAAGAPSTLLGLADQIEDLTTRGGAIAKALDDLPRRTAERDLTSGRIDDAVRPVGLDPSRLPHAGWRARARAHLDARRETARDEGELARREAALRARRQALEEALSSLGPTSSLDNLEAALRLVPEQAAQRGALAADAVRRRQAANEAILELRPWSGDVRALQQADVPAPAFAAELARELASAVLRLEEANRERERQAGLADEATAGLAGLMTAGDLPTRAAIRAARAERDRLVEQLHGAPDGEARREAHDRLVLAIAMADQLVDRAGAEATRLAEYAKLLRDQEAARVAGDAAARRIVEADAEVKELRQQWTASLASLQLGGVLEPADYSAWLATRGRVLDAERAASEAERLLQVLDDGIAAAGAALRAALAAEDVPPEPDAKVAELASLAAARLSEARDARASRQGLLEKLQACGIEAAELAAERQLLDGRAAAQATELAGLAAEAALDASGGNKRIQDALEALDTIAGDVGRLPTLVRSVKTMEDDAAVFRSDVDVLLAAAGMPATADHLAAVSDLQARLRQAQAAAEQHGRDVQALDVSTKELEQLDEERAEAARLIHELQQRTGTTDDQALDAAVAASARRGELRAQQRSAETELAEVSAGVDRQVLEGQVAALSADDAAVELQAISRRRAELNGAAEALGAERNEVERRLNAAETDAKAAEALQQVVETTTELTMAAEQHVEAAASAALLRWVLDRYRASIQAPLIARAGALFREMTGGSFVALRVGYGDDDRPIILGQRADGREVGVEAMSEGTRDQLYLSLRLGSLEGRAGRLPLICDDLLITADDGRAAAMLRALSAVSRSSQVMVFTHHDHLVEVAHRAVGADGVLVHRIERAADRRAA